MHSFLYMHHTWYRYSGQYVPNQQNFNTSGQTNPQYNQPYGNQQYGNQQQYQQQPYGNNQQYGNQQFNQPYGNQQQYQQQPFQQTQTKFCRHCGGVIPADAVVCTKCGRQVEQISQNPNGQNVVINNINNNNNGGFYTNEPVSPKNQGIALVLAGDSEGFTASIRAKSVQVCCGSSPTDFSESEQLLT